MKPEGKSVNIKTLKEEYVKEYKFITDLLHLANAPHVQSDSSDSEEHDRIEAKGAVIPDNRAKSLEELHRRLSALKKEKSAYPRIQKRKKIKLKRKKIVQRSNRNERAKLGELHARTAQRTPVSNGAISNGVVSNGAVPNGEANLVFSKMDFLGETLTVADKKSLENVKSSKKRTLEKLQKSQAYVKELEERGDVEKANEMKDEVKWMNALKRSEGIKVKDDPELLKKSLSKKEAKKRVSKKKWNDRLSNVESQKVEKQKKRKENIDKKVQEQKHKKLKKAAKKGRYIQTS